MRKSQINGEATEEVLYCIAKSVFSRNYGRVFKYRCDTERDRVHGLPPQSRFYGISWNLLHADISLCGLSQSLQQMTGNCKWRHIPKM